MNTLDEAWEWYTAVREGMKQLASLAKYWGGLPWGSEDEGIVRPAKDNVLRHVQADRLTREAKMVTDHLDDLAVLVLFSVFEANVRDLVEAQVRPEIDQLRHVALKNAGKEVLDAVAEGSFFRVLEPFKSPATNDFIEQVNQVRRYRNWVAHGRRPEKRPGALVQPQDACQRLKEFLALLRYPDPVPELTAEGD